MKYILASLMVFAFSCSEKDTNPPAPSNTELLTTGSWKYESGGVDTDRNGTIDITIESTGFPACKLDNIGTFNANGNGVNDEGLTKCNGGDPQTAAFTWSFANNETKLNISGPGFFGINGQFNITTLTTTKLSVTKDTTVGPLTALLVVNLKH